MTDTPAPPPPPEVVPAGAPGPIGRPRSTGLTIVVSLVTCGLWTIIWSYLNGEELKNYRREGLGGVGYLLITLLISPVTMFLMAGEVEQMYREAGAEPPITTLWGLWFLLPLIGNIVWYVRMQEALNGFWQARGATGAPGLT